MAHLKVRVLRFMNANAENAENFKNQGNEYFRAKRYLSLIHI